MLLLFFSSLFFLYLFRFRFFSLEDILGVDILLRWVYVTIYLYLTVLFNDLFWKSEVLSVS